MEVNDIEFQNFLNTRPTDNFLKKYPKDRPCYDLYEDDSFARFLRKKRTANISENTKKSYYRSIAKFCRAIKKPFDNIVKEIQEEQHDIIEDNVIIKYDPNNSLIADYQDIFIDYMEKKGNKNTTINKDLKNLRACLSKLGLILPDIEFLPDDADEWYLLEKRDIQYCYDLSDIYYKSLVCFMMSTGFREGDCCNLRISEFLKSTEHQHGCTELDEFLEKSPKDLIGYWDKIPTKTARFKIQCKTFNSPESSNLIIMTLHERVRLINAKNQREGTELKLTKNDYLFSSRQCNHKGRKAENSIIDYFKIRSDMLREERIRELKFKLKENEISQETYDELVKQIPRFHAHNLRSYFISMVGRHAKTNRVAKALEGHSTRIPTDPNYIKIFEEDVEETYLKALPDLTLAPMPKDWIDSEEFEEKLKKLEIEYQNKLNNQEEEFRAELNAKDSKIESLEDIIEDLQEDLGEKDTKIEVVENTLTNLESKVDRIVNPKQKVNEIIMDFVLHNHPNASEIDSNLIMKIMERLSEQDIEKGIYRDNEEYLLGLYDRTKSYILFNKETLQLEKELENISIKSNEDYIKKFQKRMEKVNETAHNILKSFGIDLIKDYDNVIEYIIKDIGVPEEHQLQVKEEFCSVFYPKFKNNPEFQKYVPKLKNTYNKKIKLQSYLELYNKKTIDEEIDKTRIETLIKNLLTKDINEEFEV